MPIAKLRSTTTLKEILTETIGLAHCMVFAFQDAQRVTSSDFPQETINQLHKAIEHAETLLQPRRSPSVKLAAEIFYELGVVIGLAQGEIDAAYRYGLDRKKKSAGGKKSRKQTTYKDHESVLLAHLCYKFLGVHKDHILATDAFNDETGLELSYGGFRKYYSKFMKGEPIFKDTAFKLTGENKMLLIQGHLRSLRGSN